MGTNITTNMKKQDKKDPGRDNVRGNPRPLGPD